MALGDQINAGIMFFTGVATIVALIGLIYTLWQYRQDQLQQQAAQTREDLKEIFRDCNRFAHPLNQDYPYPIIHTATAISKELRSRIQTSPKSEDVLRLFRNRDKELLTSIGVEGWISSTQVIRLMTIVEDLEHKASSRNVRGKLLLICHASYLLAGLVAKVCSPESFVEMLQTLEVPCSQKDRVEDILNEITVELQQGICKAFNETYRDTIKRSLYFIQTAASAFMKLEDKDLMKLAKDQNKQAPLCNITDPEIKADPIIRIEEEALLLSRVRWVKTLLDDLRDDIKDDYKDLCELIDPIETACVTLLEAAHFKKENADKPAKRDGNEPEVPQVLQA